MLVIALLVKIYSPGPALFWSERVGKDNQIFNFPKFRSMRIDTPHTMQHLVAADAITPLGKVADGLAESLEELSAPPIEDYNELNVGKVVAALDALSEVILPQLPADFPRDQEVVRARFIATGDIRFLRQSLSAGKAAGRF